ncbi:MAG: four-helix bundle copper-binding protein [Isosphaeraceae bacterium]
MKRREMIGVLGMGAAALVTTEAMALAAQEAKDKDHDHHHDHHEHVRIIGECALICNMTAHHCLEKLSEKDGDAKAHAKVQGLAMDCQEFCVLTLTLMARHSELSKYAHEACVEACRCCAEACEASSEQSDQVKKCAKACRDCEKTCRDMLKQMKH